MYKKIFAAYINNNTKKIGSDIFINCPFHNDKTASCAVSTNPDKPVYHCFSCGKKGSWIGFYMEQNKCSFTDALNQLNISNYKVKEYKSPEKPIKKYLDLTDDVLSYQLNFEKEYMVNGKDLYDKIGLTLTTSLACFIGKKNDNWIFPIFRYPDAQIVGYEVRPNDLKSFQHGNKCYKNKLPDGFTIDCFSITFSGNMKKRVIICEGFKDSYFVYQYLCEKEQRCNIDDTIITPTCGVKTIPALLKENNFDNFDNILFILDNDDAGNEVKEIIKKYDDRYSFFNKLKENEDFEKYYNRIKTEVIKHV